MDIESYAGDILWGPPRGPQGQPGAPGACWEGPRVVKNDLLKPKNIVFRYKILKIMYECIWMTAELYGRFILGSKALRGNLNHSGVAPGGVKNHP